MREILFRGKRVENGEWIYWDRYGRITDINGEPIRVEINTSALRPYAFYVNELPVIREETVGEYTGLTDKNGKKIFEGDIVKNSRDVGLLYYKEKNSAFTVKGWEYGYWLWHDKDDIEVIGNIHDNPELLEEI